MKAESQPQHFSESSASAHGISTPTFPYTLDRPFISRPVRAHQETRSVVVALMQRIVFSEWLPLVIGPDLVRELRLNQPGRYRPGIHPGIVNEFAAAAFRFGHSLVAGRIRSEGEVMVIVLCFVW